MFDTWPPRINLSGVHMLNYYPPPVIFQSEKNCPERLQHACTRTDNIPNPTPRRSKRSMYNSMHHHRSNGCNNHMNGHRAKATTTTTTTTEDRSPVLGPGYRIVEPPTDSIQASDCKMAPSSEPGKARTGSKVRFRCDGSPPSPRGGEPVRNGSRRHGEASADGTPPSRVLQDQSTQTDNIYCSNQTVVLNRSPTRPSSPSRTGGDAPFVSASWSAGLPGGEEEVESEEAEGGRAGMDGRSDGRVGTDEDPGSDADSVRNPAEDVPLSVILVGDSGTGKTCLVARLADNLFVENYDVTVGIDFNIARFTLPDGRHIRLQLWDTAGQEKYRAITSSYYRKAMGVVLVYDVTRRETLDNVLQVWLKEVDKYAESNVVLMLVGNKMDLDDYRTITTRVGIKVAQQLGATFFEVSAKENLHVRSAFQAFAQDVLDKVCAQRNPCLSSNAVHIGLSNHDRDEDKKTKGVCNCA